MEKQVQKCKKQLQTFGIRNAISTSYYEFTLKMLLGVAVIYYYIKFEMQRLLQS